MTRQHFRTIFAAQKIRRLVSALARQVDDYYAAVGAGEVVIVCVMNASFMVCADLVRKLKTPTRVLFTQARSYRGRQKGRTAVDPIPENLREKHVLVVDTIFDTGKTIDRVVREVRKQTNKVEVAVLVVKNHKSARARQKAIRFKGAELPGDPFLVGYGLDLEGEHRGRKDICEIEESES